jgi:hypothetical protein
MGNYQIFSQASEKLNAWPRLELIDCGSVKPVGFGPKHVKEGLGCGR